MASSDFQTPSFDFTGRPDRLASAIDHTLLKPTASAEQIVKLCSEAMQCGFYSVCIHPVFVKLAARELAGHQPLVATVISFPFGLDNLQTKLTAVSKAIEDGAGELDVVFKLRCSA